jgi:hypothetical protein
MNKKNLNKLILYKIRKIISFLKNYKKEMIRINRLY